MADRRVDRQLNRVDRALRTGLAVSVLALLVVCSTYVPPNQEQPRNPRVLTRAELAGQIRTLGDAIRELRPGLLNSRGGRLQLFVDRAPFDVSYLDLLSAQDVERVEWISESDAQFEFGPRSTGAPALVIQTRRGPQ